MYGKPQSPSKNAILQAPDRLIARHLRVVGAISAVGDPWGFDTPSYSVDALAYP